MMYDDKNKPENTDNKVSEPNPETLHTTDPQENMEGPVSDMIQDTGDVFDGSDETKKEANEEREKGF